jgi:hypothetical protein
MSFPMYSYIRNTGISNFVSSKAKELLDISREYITAIRLKLAISDLAEKDDVRSTELCAYFTHCSLQPGHLFLALKQAMVQAFRVKNYVTAASFAHRLLELPEVSSDKNADLKSKVELHFFTKPVFSICLHYFIGSKGGY